MRECFTVKVNSIVHNTTAVSESLTRVFYILSMEIYVNIVFGYRYDRVESDLFISIEQARNLAALNLPENCQV